MLDFNPPGPAGLLPLIFSTQDPRPAREQIEDRYAHGGGYRPFDGFEYSDGQLWYPEDPPLQEVSRAQLRDETIILFEFGFVAIIQPDGSRVVVRMD